MGALSPNIGIPVKLSQVNAEPAIWSGLDGLTVMVGSLSWLVSALLVAGTMLTRVTCGDAAPANNAMTDKRLPRMGKLVRFIECSLPSGSTRISVVGPDRPKPPTSPKVSSAGYGSARVPQWVEHRAQKRQ